MRYIKTNQAFTLIEVLASITLLSIVLAIFLPFFANSIELSSKTEDKLTAINLAERELRNEMNKFEASPINSCPTTPITKQIEKTNNKEDYYSTVEFICGEKELNLVPMKISISRNEYGNNPITALYGYVELSSN
ncbi:prepilin-type N-terminal cleavage/methylation domain-containing protein [Bacillus sp. AGMB 02131]|uniref:Prepilin-type N-terminal cleavage/methylation domain-containing protein n=1 Tax=Peribacillus faecalis TaxID=2772559 RepID=A0A927CU11_9BACI|nr:prepilin-type N-terminal cleavage/methylation domain-containing protein [Peribacillus faecalis]MBD3107822.1 prepilin-type N-terminal cleavage/methylation domain-containing protein [Peribacillus faecalis]